MRTFNLGVEAGQLAIVVVALGVLALLGRISRGVRRISERFAAYTIGITASFWLIARAVS